MSEPEVRTLAEELGYRLDVAPEEQEGYRLKPVSLAVQDKYDGLKFKSLDEAKSWLLAERRKGEQS